MKELFLSLLKDARLDQRSQPQSGDFVQLYRMAVQHEVSALIYNQIYHFPALPPELKQSWSREAIKVNALQTMRTARFLQLYQQLTAQGITCLVVKGIVLRALYPQPDSRPSNDEDMYVHQSQFDRASAVLLHNGMVKVNESKDVTTFLDPRCGLSIELHVALFNEENKAYGRYQVLFRDAFAHPATHVIQGVAVQSLDYDLHLLFLMTHLAKHFLVSGVGIRQVLDIVMYAEAYGKDIHWQKVYDALDEIGLLTLTQNVFSIGHAYLGFDYGKIALCPGWDGKADHEALLEDILDAGVYGKSTQARLHSSAFTIQAVEQSGATKAGTLLRMAFLPLRELRERSGYTYLKKKPWLLPYAHMHRICKYLSHRETDKQEQKTVAVGAQRVELLKQYGLIRNEAAGRASKAM